MQPISEPLQVEFWPIPMKSHEGFMAWNRPILQGGWKKPTITEGGRHLVSFHECPTNSLIPFYASIKLSAIRVQWLPTVSAASTTNYEHWSFLNLALQTDIVFLRVPLWQTYKKQWKITMSISKSTINGRFSTAMWNYRRVEPIISHYIPMKILLNPVKFPEAKGLEKTPATWRKLGLRGIAGQV